MTRLNQPMVVSAAKVIMEETVPATRCTNGIWNMVARAATRDAAEIFCEAKSSGAARRSEVYILAAIPPQQIWADKKESWI